MDQPFIFVENLTKAFASAGGGQLTAVDNFSFSINQGEVFGLLGESGSGKTTLARLILRLINPDKGAVYFNGENIFLQDSDKLKTIRSKIQIVFQNPYASLNPRIKIGPAVAEPLLIHKICPKAGALEKARELLEAVGLQKEDFFKFPYQFSAGQRQRIAIARALILNPEFLVLDEPVSSLDVTIQKQILDLLLDLKHKLNLTFLFITHDVKIISNISSQLGVMKEGRLVETGPTASVLSAPKSEYTRNLLEFVF